VARERALSLSCRCRQSRGRLTSSRGSREQRCLDGNVRRDDNRASGRASSGALKPRTGRCRHGSSSFTGTSAGAPTVLGLRSFGGARGSAVRSCCGNTQNDIAIGDGHAVDNAKRNGLAVHLRVWGRFRRWGWPRESRAPLARRSHRGQRFGGCPRGAWRRGRNGRLGRRGASLRQRQCTTRVLAGHAERQGPFHMPMPPSTTMVCPVT
jgi:hypothetical protein